MENYGLFMWINILLTGLITSMNYIMFNDFATSLFIGCCGVIVAFINLIMDL